MLSKQGLLKQANLDKSCNCSILSLSSQVDQKENFFLAPASPAHVRGRHPQVFRKQQVKTRVRRSLKAQKIDKQNRLSNQLSSVNCQPKTTSSNSLLMDLKFQEQQQLFSQNRELCRQPLFNIQNMPYNSSNGSKAITTQLENVGSKIIQQTIKEGIFKKNTLQTRFSENYSQNKVEKIEENGLRPMKLDRAQSSGNFFIPKLKLNDLPPKRGSQWRSQFVNAQLEKSTSKLTHRLTDLNVKCTESINDSESLRISEVVSESEGSPSDTHRTQTLPKRIKDLMHIKYSKIQGRKY